MARVSVVERAKQFKDLNADGKVLFCKYCQHSIDYFRVDSIIKEGSLDPRLLSHAEREPGTHCLRMR